MSQKKTSDKNLDLGNNDMPVASRLTYYTPQPSEPSVAKETSEVEHADDASLRRPLHASIDEVKEAASIIDYSMFFNDTKSSITDTVETQEATATFQGSLSTSIDDETREQILSLDKEKEQKNAEEQDTQGIYEYTEIQDKETDASNPIRPSLLATMGEDEVRVSELAKLSLSDESDSFKIPSDTNIEINSETGSTIRPSLLASMEEESVKEETALKNDLNKIDTQNNAQKLQEETALQTRNELASREVSHCVIDTEQETVRPSLGLLSASKLSKKNMAKLHIKSKHETETKTKKESESEKAVAIEGVETSKSALQDVPEKTIKRKIVPTKTGIKNTGVTITGTAQKIQPKTTKIISKVAPKLLETKTISPKNKPNEAKVESQNLENKQNVAQIVPNLEGVIRPNLMQQAKGEIAEEAVIRQNLLEQIGQGVQIEQVVAEQSLAAQNFADLMASTQKKDEKTITPSLKSQDKKQEQGGSETLVPPSAEHVNQQNLKEKIEVNSLTLEQDSAPLATALAESLDTLKNQELAEKAKQTQAIQKSTYTSVLDRLTDDDNSAVNIFGDGTSLTNVDEEEKSIFSSAFADEKETDVVKVAFFQRKAKKNLTTAELAALPYFQEDKEFMSKVDEAWYDQGEKSSKNLVLVFSGLLLFFVTWAAFASIDEVARGQGQVVPSQRMQLLQHLEGGILNDVLVAEGDTVEPDQILARVDNVSAASSLRDIESQITEASLALIRLEAEREGIEPVFPEKYMILAPEIVAAQEQTFMSRSLQQESSYGIFEQQIEQKHQELNEAMSRQRTYENAQALVQKRVDIARPLVSKKLYPEVDFLNLKQELVRLDGDIDAEKNSIAKINAEVKEAEGRLNLSKKEFMSEVIKEINTLRSEIATLEQGKTAGTDRVTRTELRSQVRGVVNRILLNTKGGVVKPGESIMEIVPLDDTLVIETKVRPQDIAFIHPNQKAVVRITAYDASIYGTMDGFVEQIGADTVTDEQGEIFFLIKVRTEKSAIIHNGETLPIMPGMIASVDILTGKKTVLSYLLKPITKASQYALKER